MENKNTENFWQSFLKRSCQNSLKEFCLIIIYLWVYALVAEIQNI